MNRTLLRKLLYPALLLTIFALLTGLFLSGKISTVALFGIALGLFLLGRLINYPIRHFYQGLHAFKQQKLDEAERLFHTFLERVEHRPWIKHLVWWSFGVYTFDLEAMAWNNLGAIYIRQGRLPEAKKCLEKAIALDPKYPKPFFNLAVSAIGEGQTELAAQYFEQAKKLGYAGGAFDQFLTTIQEEYAKVNAKLN